MRAAKHMPIPNLARSYPDRTNLDAAYRFKPLPVTEAAASSTEFVCEFNGGASANETGAGGGLSGADLVFIQNNGVPAVAGGYRQIVKDTTMSFSPTIPFVNTFIRSTAGFSMLYRLKDLDIGAPSGYVLALLQTAGYSTGGLNIYSTMQTLNRRTLSHQAKTYNATDSIGVVLNNSDALSSNPAAAEFMLLASNDYATRTSLVGILAGTAQPTKLSDFLSFAMVRGDAAFTIPAAATTWEGVRNAIIGAPADYPNGAVGVKVGSITFAKYPCFVPV